MQIGTVAQQAGVAIDTVRYYERKGLLPPPRRRASGYRDYDASDLARMRFIGRAKALGFSLADIAGLLDLSSRRNDDMAGMKRTAGQKLVEVDARIAELTRIRAALQALVDSCPGHGELESCPILHALDEASP